MCEAPQLEHLGFLTSLMSEMRGMTISTSSIMTEAAEMPIVMSYSMMRMMFSDMLMLTMKMQLAFKGNFLVNDIWLSR